MSTPTQSRTFSIIQGVAALPLMQKGSDLISHFAGIFSYGAKQPNTRFATVVVATLLTAGGLWGLNMALNRVPVYFVKRTLLPTCEWAIKASLAWVIFEALMAGSTAAQAGWNDDDHDGSGPNKCVPS